MAVSSGFYNSLNRDRRYTAEQLSSIFDGVIEDGIYASIYETTDGDPKPFKIIPGETGLSVVVRKGRSWFRHTWLYNDGDITITLDDAPATGQSRIDLIVIRVDTENRINTIDKLTGTPSSSNPVAPSVREGVDGVYEYEIGKITVLSSYTTIPLVAIDQTAIGSTVPYVTAPVQSISISSYLVGWENEFQSWMLNQNNRMNNFMASISGLLTTEQAGYLLDLFDNMHHIELSATYDVSDNSFVGKYVVCSNGVRNFTAVTTNSGTVTFNIGDQRADESLGVAYDSCLGTWSIAMYESASDLTPIGDASLVNAYYYGIYPAVPIGGEITPDFDFNFTFAANNNVYSFNSESESSSLANVYNYHKDSESNDWYLIVYTTGILKFAALTTNLDVCAVGGGGGGGGGNANAWSSGAWSCYGGNGGGGYYQEEIDGSFDTDSEYSLNIGSGGSAGGAYGGAGSSGTSTTIIKNGETVLSANGGGGGGGGISGGTTGSAGTGGSARYCFNDSAYPSVSGPNRNSYKGGGGGAGSGTAWSNKTGMYKNATAGSAGAAGLIVIRNTRQA